MVEKSLETYGYDPDPVVGKIFGTYRKTHNDGVFDVYPPDVRAARSSHLITGPARRLRPRPHHRRLPPRRAVRRERADRGEARGARRARHPTGRPRTSSGPARRTPSRSARCSELKTMAASYGYDISGPATTGREAVQWLYFAYLGAVKEQNGAAMSLGRTSTFLDIYLQRDLDAGVLTEEQVQELVDDFVIKLRIVRFLRTPEYDELFSGDPTWVTETIGGHRPGRPAAGHPHLVPVPADALQPGPGPRAEPDRVLERPAARRLQAVLRAGVDRHLRGPVRVRRADPLPPGATTPRSRAASRRCAWASRCSSSALA